MVPQSFTSLIDVASQLAWQVTLTLMHVLWVGTSIIILAAIADHVLAQHKSSGANSGTEPGSSRVRYQLNMVALLMVGAALPVSFIVVRESAFEVSTASSDSVGIAVDSSENTFNLLDRSSDAAFGLPNRHSEFGIVERQPPSMTGNHAGESVLSFLNSILNRVRRTAPVIALIYLTGVLMMFLRLTAAICGGQRLTSLGRPVVEQSILDVLSNQAERLALKVVPAVAYCERVAVPVVVGFLRPVILLPAAMTSGLSSQELAAVFAHELAHVRRFDHVLIVMQRFLEALLFFHPAVWWLGRRIHDLREHACDDLVLEAGIDRLDYARSLLRVAELQVHDDTRIHRLAQLALDGGHPSKLRQRIQRIVQCDDEPGVRLNQSRATFAVVATVLAIVIAVFSKARSARRQSRQVLLTSRLSQIPGASLHSLQLVPATDPSLKDCSISQPSCTLRKCR
jgi:beta-lactamase regulating signal transducer with metallopeptidase domain